MTDNINLIALTKILISTTIKSFENDGKNIPIRVYIIYIHL